jgi:predicted small secreted protein
MKKSKLFLFVALLLGASLLAACGQTAAPTGNPAQATVAPVAATVAPVPATVAPVAANNSNPSACTLLTKDDVSKVLGEAVVDTRDPSKKGILCVYQTKNLILEMNTLHAFGGWGNSVEYMKQTRVDGVGEPALDVLGLGDEAFYHGSAAYRLLLVRKGETVYSTGVRNVTADQSLSSPDNAQAMEKALAELVLSHLP